MPDSSPKNSPHFNFPVFCTAPQQIIPHDFFREHIPAYPEVESRPRFPVVALLDNIRSMFNVGSMFRTADGCWLEEILLTGYTATPPRPEIAKTALGAEYSVPWRYVPDPLQALKALKRRGYQIVVLEQTRRTHHYARAPYRFPLVLVVGNEGVGVQEHLVEACDLAVELPQHGLKSSLNVAVAFGIITYTLRERWEQQRRLGKQILNSGARVTPE